MKLIFFLLILVCLTGPDPDCGLASVLALLMLMVGDS